jgi:hypothetical protein
VASSPVPELEFDESADGSVAGIGAEAGLRAADLRLGAAFFVFFAFFAIFFGAALRAFTVFFFFVGAAFFLTAFFFAFAFVFFAMIVLPI